MKERKISRRAVCSAMVASLALGVLEGCGSSSSTTSSAAGSGAAASNERITVRILKSKAANEVAAEQMDVWKVLGEKFNMDFEFDNPPQDNYNERLNLVMMDAQLPVSLPLHQGWQILFYLLQQGLWIFSHLPHEESLHGVHVLPSSVSPWHPESLPVE